jgi:hypothetical protein
MSLRPDLAQPKRRKLFAKVDYRQKNRSAAAPQRRGPAVGWVAIGRKNQQR